MLDSSAAYSLIPDSTIILQQVAAKSILNAFTLFLINNPTSKIVIDPCSLHILLVYIGGSSRSFVYIYKIN